MVRLDYAYVSNWTLIEDLRILMKTAGVVVQSGQGAY
jgi:lipopolysaccharide/colanic/teichoic acid biosynthesis glycosyltransferase